MENIGLVVLIYKCNDKANLKKEIIIIGKNKFINIINFKKSLLILS